MRCKDEISVLIHEIEHDTCVPFGNSINIIGEHI